MEVIRKNFKESLPQVSDSIKKADFLVIDAEFTGLINGRDVMIFDTPREYYDRLLKGSTDFLLVQFGLCAFYYDEERKMYMNDAYNFYLFPRGRPGPEKIFMCQSSSLDFLAAQGFDFNKLIRDGISYMTEPTETRLRENLTERQKNYSKEKDIINIPDEHKSFVDETCKKVQQFLDENKSDEMEIDRCNAFVRMLLYQELKLQFKDKILLETKILENKNRILRVVRVKSDTDATDQEAMKKAKEWEEFEDAVGFSKVAQMISASEKLVIGHNMLLDVMHTLNHFFQALPEDYTSFKEFAHCMFPRLLDTKYMSSLPPFKDKANSSVLPHLLLTLSEPPFSMPKVGSYEGRGYSRAEEKLHEAGYDAYITGLCFLAMHAHLSQMRGEEHGRLAPDSAVLKPFLNKIFLAKTAHQDSPYMNLTGPDPTPAREHVFYLTFPKEWVRAEISQLFSPFGQILVQFVDDTHAWVALMRRDQARLALRAIGKNSRITLRSYDEQKLMTLRTTQRASEIAVMEQMKKASTITGIPEPRHPPGYLATNIPVPSALSPPSPEKVVRVRAKSVSLPSPPQPARKRTSSGVFEVDDAEPPPKKNEHARTQSDGALKKSKLVTNGRREGTEAPEHEIKKKQKKIIERFDGFDGKAKQTNVAAFKESDSWD